MFERINKVDKIFSSLVKFEDFKDPRKYDSVGKRSGLADVSLLSDGP